MTTAELVAYGADGEEIKRLDYGRVVEGQIARQESAQADTTMADAVREAVRAGEIEAGENPCTYPPALREIIGLTDEQCDGELGRRLERQYK